MKKLIAISVVLALLFTSCKKDDFTLTGSLNVSFINTGSANVSQIEPQIYSSDNLETPILEDLTIDSNLRLTVKCLNYGNYVIKYQKVKTPYVYVESKGFQINPEKTTNLVISFY